MSIRILLADDHKIVRDGLRSLLEKEEGMEVIAEADTGRAAVRLAALLAPEVVLMDIAMPELNGIEAARQIIAAVPGCKVIALSMHADKRYVMEMLKAGASGYLLKDSAFEELAHAIRTALDNRTYLSPQVSELVIGDYVQQLQKGNGSAFSVLSPREREVLQLLAEGNSTAQIAAGLHVSVKTVETYRQHIMEKLNIRNIAELTKYAIREGITSL
ncbi:MAG: response regulator transcription factor [Geobacteraceae bacterium]|nr:response regulator transcription factor [Geobacteraceae bacterium]